MGKSDKESMIELIQTMIDDAKIIEETLDKINANMRHVITFAESANLLGYSSLSKEAYAKKSEPELYEQLKNLRLRINGQVYLVIQATALLGNTRLA